MHPARRMAGVYAPRSPTTSVLYGVVRSYLAAFRTEVDARTDGLPPFVVNALPLSTGLA